MSINEAKAAAILGDAEGSCNQLLARARAGKSRQLRMDIFEALSNNPDVILTGNDSQEINELLLMDTLLESLPSQGSKKEDVVNEVLTLHSTMQGMPLGLTGLLGRR